MTLLKLVRESLEKRSAYQRTKADIEKMPLEVALDLGIFREDAARIAAKAVYG